MKSVQIWAISGSYFPVLSDFLYYLFFRIVRIFLCFPVLFPVLSVLSKYRKIQAKNNSVFRHFSRSSGNFEDYNQQQKMKECMDSFAFK